MIRVLEFDEAFLLRLAARVEKIPFGVGGNKGHLTTTKINMVIGPTPKH
jgi:hypothetical protein